MKKSTISIRLKQLRDEQKLTQSEFAIKLSELKGRTPPYSLSAVSSWETGAKLPSLSTLTVIAEFFNVSLEYLRGLSNERNALEHVDYDYLELKYHIAAETISAYDGTPVWIEFEDLTFKNQWGIVDVESQTIICAKIRIPFKTKGIKTYAIPLPNDIFKETFLAQPIPWNRIMTLDTFWVEIVSTDKLLSTQYNGWYHHNENRTGIINAVGLTLPYEGFGTSWRAYVEPFRNRAE